MKRRKSSVTSFNVPALSFFEDMFGDEFPEAFSNGNGGERKKWATILDLPTELLQMACSYLPQRDIKRLRLSNAQLAAKVEPRFDHIFISPNRANLQVLLCILDHPRFRLCVEEIVWDNSLLEEFPTLESFGCAIQTQERMAKNGILRRVLALLPDEDMKDIHDSSIESSHSHNGLLTDDTKMRLLRLDTQESRDLLARDATTMGMEESYTLYQKLYQDEQEIMKRGWDVTAFHRALAEFPNLKRITLTSAIWSTPDTLPSRATPFFRALPPGFRKPWVRPWKEDRADREENQEQTVTGQRLPFQWRTYSVAMAILVKYPHPGIETIDIDASMNGSGVNSQLFATPNGDYDMTVETCRALSLKSFRLAISGSKAFEDGGQFIKSGLLKNLFSTMVHLQHLDFALNMSQPEPFKFNADDVFPETILHRLRHFTLRNIENLEDPFGLIVKLENAESIALVQVGFRESYYELLHRLREHYSTKTCQPRFTFTQPGSFSSGLCVFDTKIDDFLYRNGECPIAENAKEFSHEVGRYAPNEDPARCERFESRNCETR